VPGLSGKHGGRLKLEGLRDCLAEAPDQLGGHVKRQVLLGAIVAHPYRDVGPPIVLVADEPDAQGIGIEQEDPM